ncbi:hypothetical protein MB84_31405 (plasmid) [Pandoraea oxalativorans]|uniref:Uncharacterized protein n=1 Tax=Pandoraea oxalativorans TaxID=573737 RepID=A0A192B160_9BURK|nr:hypothetical protein MB84_31405 [Pandoraea oxalativorans]
MRVRFIHGEHVAATMAWRALRENRGHYRAAFSRRANGKGGRPGAPVDDKQTKQTSGRAASKRDLY